MSSVGAHTTTLEVGGARQVVADYVTLTKPRVQLLLLLTTVTTMYVAGDPSVGLVLLTCLGGSLSAGGAGAVNHFYDRDIDAQMARTATRPVPAGRISPRARSRTAAPRPARSARREPAASRCAPSARRCRGRTSG